MPRLKASEEYFVLSQEDDTIVYILKWDSGGELFLRTRINIGDTFTAIKFKQNHPNSHDALILATSSNKIQIYDTKIKTTMTDNT